MIESVASKLHRSDILVEVGYICIKAPSERYRYRNRLFSFEKNVGDVIMANTYTQLYIHVVFAVKNRQSLIHKDWKDELYKYICGTATGVKQKIYAINGVANHVHILLSISPSVALSE